MKAYQQYTYKEEQNIGYDSKLLSDIDSSFFRVRYLFRVIDYSNVSSMVKKEK